MKRTSKTLQELYLVILTVSQPHYSLPVLCGKKAATRQVLISARADSKLRRLHDIYMLQCADVDKLLDRYRYTWWNAVCGGRFEGDNLSSV